MFRFVRDTYPNGRVPFSASDVAKNFRRTRTTSVDRAILRALRNVSELRNGIEYVWPGLFCFKRISLRTKARIKPAKFDENVSR